MFNSTNYSSMMDGDDFNSTSELTCQQKQVEFGNPLPLSSDVANVLRYMQVAYYFICLPFGLFLNLMVISLILRFKKLQNVTFILAFQVSVNDLFNVILVFPTSAANAIADRYVFTGLCPVIGFIVFYLRIARIYLMLVLALDRFCTVFLPFWYHRKRNRVKVIVLLSLVAWSLAFVVALIPQRGLLDCYSFQRNTWACVPTNGCLHRNECSVYISTAIAVSNFCNVVSLLLYFSLFCKARRLRNKLVKQHQSTSNGKDSKATTTQKLTIRERRANVTFFLLFLALAGVSFPPFLFFVVGRPVITSLNIVPHPAYTIAGVIGRAFYPLLTIMDPIVIMRNADFREVTRNICGRFKKSTYSSPRRHSSVGTASTNEPTMSSV